MRRNLKAYRYRLEALGCRILTQCIPRLSRHACVGLGQLAGALAYHFDARGRRIGIANITAALGEKYSGEELEEIVRKSYQNFAVTMLSLFWSPRITEANAPQYLEMSGFKEALERASREGRGVVFVCAHEGNWEWGAVAFSLLGGWASIVAEDFKNPSLTEIFVQLRARNRHRVIPQDKSILKMLRAVLRGESAGLVGDLNLDPGGAAVVVEAFKKDGVGLEMCATRLHAVLAKRGRALLVPVLTLPLPGGRCRVMAQAPVELDSGGERLICQRTWDVFESFILERPELWLWAYKHFRYRPENACRSYPFYSSTNPDFEAMRGELW
ncbi:MAG: Lauroyl/myristoyl acyltransferase [Verrucomicrobia bacterium]|nr:MAG: Lauroyl/myristoyl acyltransferase [Verrucomicrobiota bacterium]